MANPLDAPLVVRLAWTLVHSVWEGLGVAVLLAIALGYAYRASARVRYGLGCAALTLLLLGPLVTFLLLGASGPESLGVRPSTETMTLDRTIVVGSYGSGSGWPLLLVGLWLAGVAFFSLRLIGSLVQIERWRRRHCRPAEGELVARVEALAQRLRITRPVRVLVSESATIPGVWGVLRPVLVLPLGFLTGLPPSQAEAILLHELTHVRRLDYLVNLLQTVVETLLFFHPATWWISSLVRREREHCCDDLVVATLGDPLPYARALLSLEERRHALPSPALSARGGSLMNRIRRILARPAAPSRLLPTASAVATLGLVAAVLGGAFQAQAQVRTPRGRPLPPRAAASPAAVRAAREAQMRAEARLAMYEQQLRVARRQVAIANANLRSVQARLQTETGGKRAATVVPPTTKAAESPLVRVAPARTAAFDAYAVAKIFEDRTAKVAPPLAPRASGKGDGSDPGRPVTATKDSGTAATDTELSVAYFNDTQVSLTARLKMFPDVMRRLAVESRRSVVIEAGQYGYVDLILQDKSFDQVLDALCRAGKATFQIEHDIYYITPLTKTGGGLGGGGIGGGGFGQ